MAVASESKAAAKSSWTADRCGICIMGGVWWKQSVVPHYAWNTNWDVYSDDHGDLWQLEPQHDIDGGR